MDYAGNIAHLSVDVGTLIITALSVYLTCRRTWDARLRKVEEGQAEIRGILKGAGFL